jgi:hypothetical protein
VVRPAARARRAASPDVAPADTAALDAACQLTRRGSASLAVARLALEAGREVAPDAATQYLGFVAELLTVAAQLEPRACGALPPGAGAGAPTEGPGEPPPADAFPLAS